MKLVTDLLVASSSPPKRTQAHLKYRASLKLSSTSQVVQILVRVILQGTLLVLVK
jgi:hypothetical protein